MNWKTTLERHDSAPEEQPRRRAGCDWDHFISLNPQLRRYLPFDHFPQKARHSVRLND
jgi:hypothetical protein